MSTPLGFDVLKGILHQRTAQLPDHRQEGPNTRYAIQDGALGAFGIFFTQSPSFLEYQRRLQHTKGHNNAHALFGVQQIPCDNQYALLRRVLARRQTFCDDIRALMRYMVFDSWSHLMDFMIQGLELQPQVDTS